MMPLLAMMSVAVTVALLFNSTLPFTTEMATSLPSSVVAVDNATTTDAGTAPETTW
jgi:hypothetical protein